MRQHALARLNLALGSVALLSVSLPTAGFAQTLVQSTQTITYQHLANPTVLYTDVDDGQTNLTLPFPVTFYGTTQTSVSVGANGALAFPGGTFVSLTNQAPGTAGAPNGFIAGWWDDLRLYSANGGNIGWQVFGTAPNRTIEIQWRQISRFGGPTTDTVSFKVRMFEGPSTHIEVDYGPATIAGTTFNATAGMEDTTNANPFLFAASNCTTNCTSADFTALVNTRVIVINAPNPELTGSFGTFPPGALPGASTTGDIVLTNLGTQTATGVVGRVWLSADNMLDMTDTQIGTITQDLPQGNSPVTINLTVPAMQPVQVYNTLLEVDATNIWSEINEQDNVIQGPPFATGYEMQPTNVTITNPGFLAAGMPIDYAVEITNNGAPYSGPVTIELWLSLDATLDMTDTLVATVVGNATGGAVDVINVSGTMPTIPVGHYRPAVRIDPQNAIVEGDETNNDFVGELQVISGQDFTLTTPSATPAVTEVGLPMTVMATAQSRGTPFPGALEFGVFLSLDATFDPGDQAIYRGTVTFGAQSDVPIDVTFPVSALPGDPQLAPGTYTIFVVVDPDDDEQEALEMNNSLPAGEVEILGADLRVESITGDAFGFIGLPYRVALEIENQGVADARAFQYSIRISENDIIRVTDPEIFLSPTATIASGQNATFEAMVTLPTFTATTARYIGVIVDIFSRVPETSESNNTGRIQQAIPIVFPIPDLVGQIVQTPTSAAAGEQLSITRIVENIGVAPAPNYTYTYYLSTNDTIDPSDIQLSTFNGSLATGADDYGIDTMLIPSNVPQAQYYVGLVIDEANTVEEVYDDNNVAVTAAPIPVFDAAIEITTNTLPDGTTGVPYSTGVYANGGALPIQWSINAGALPDGLTLEAGDGIISGTPTTEGVFTFTARASSGTAYADKEFSVRIKAPTVELAIATPSLPAALSGRPYETSLIAVGGVQPYTWTSNGQLPVGMELRADGTLTGNPVGNGDFPVRFIVTDDVGDSATKELIVKVLGGGQTIQITQMPLPGAIIGTEYCDPAPIEFVATDGTEPYSWSIVGEGIPGMTMSQSGQLCGVPTTAGSFEFVVRVQDALQLYDTSLFILEVSDDTDLAISTTSLEDADVGVEYSSTLTAILGVEPYSWGVVEGAGELPPGITLGEDGRLTGTPTEGGNFAFVVRVIDGVNSQDVQPLSLYVEPKPAGSGGDGDDGCGCSTAETSDAPMASLALLLLLGLGLTVRRRR